MPKYTVKACIVKYYNIEAETETRALEKARIYYAEDNQSFFLCNIQTEIVKVNEN